jgi:extradiol dioxygenase family protein
MVADSVYESGILLHVRHLSKSANAAALDQHLIDLPLLLASFKLNNSLEWARTLQKKGIHMTVRQGLVRLCLPGTPHSENLH